jgi:hypothetical protein
MQLILFELSHRSFELNRLQPTLTSIQCEYKQLNQLFPSSQKTINTLYPQLQALTIKNILANTDKSRNRMNFYLPLFFKKLLTLKLDYLECSHSLGCSKVFQSLKCTLKSFTVLNRTILLNSLPLRGLSQLQHLNVQFDNTADFYFLLLHSVPVLKYLNVKLTIVPPVYLESVGTGSNISPYLKQFHITVIGYVNYNALESLILKFNRSLKVVKLNFYNTIHDTAVIDGNRLGESSVLARIS